MFNFIMFNNSNRWRDKCKKVTMGQTKVGFHSKEKWQKPIARTIYKMEESNQGMRLLEKAEL